MPATATAPQARAAKGAGVSLSGGAHLEPLARNQLTALAGSLSGVLVTGLVWRYAPQLFRGLALPADGAADRLAFAARWLLVPGLTLLAGVTLMAARRFLCDAIDGTRTPLSHSLEINLRYNLNTLEQTVLAAIAWSGVALTVPHARLYLIPALALLFAVGRAAFWIGYLIHPMGRAFGMVLTSLPTLIALVSLGLRLMRRGALP
jgi:hypothetical protein